MRAVSTFAFVIIAVFPVLADAGTCQNGYMAEGQAPPAIDGINTGETGFRSYYWAWGAAETTDQGTVPAGLTIDGSGLAVNNGILWANSDNCSGTIGGTALLLEAQTVSTGGKVALIAIQGAEANLDFLQIGLGQSVAETIPIPSISAFAFGNDGYDFVDYRLQWTVPSGAWALSDVADVLAGFAVYYVTSTGGGPVNDGDKSLFTRVLATPESAIPYITEDEDNDDGLLKASQTSCIVRIRPGEDHYFVISLIFDGTAAGSDPQADANAVETTFVGACSAPANGISAIFIDGFESGDTSMWSAVE